MRIEHVGLWTQDLENMKEFYCKFFKATASEKYHNPNSKFSSYFLTFADGARLELCHRPDIVSGNKDTFGFAHLAFSLGSEKEVDRFAYFMAENGYPIQNGPRRTGDGYYEATIYDPEGNQIELTV
ncbi:lactoylglutathione lyase [Streptococcus equinus]|uniref:Lactoylglutathione lyase n=1 Tax=Streptococcus equinus TaxID=1335 RepID=A0A1H0Z7V6_STREI|nr:VOC family protein [Streptococcus equinus]SDQ23474.1 lactoylglutathione lyase [Streptococcus equinus]